MRRMRFAAGSADSRNRECNSHFRGNGIWAAVAIGVVLAGNALAAGGIQDEHNQGEAAYRSGDVVTAMTTLRRVAEKGYAPSQVLLAEILDRAEFNEEAISWYRKAAEQGDPAGEFGIGSMYLAGEGVKKDPGQAWFWFSRAADRKFAPAVIALANAHARTDADARPTGPEAARAAERLGLAAELDYLPAVDALARAYREGGYGLQPSGAQADRYSTQAAALRKKNSSEKGARKK